jgi:hypothetical protein
MATFQEQIDALVAKHVPADKLEVVKSELIPLFGAMTRTFQDYDRDINDMKEKVRKVEGIKPEDFARLENVTKEQATTLAQAKADLEKAKTDYTAAVTQLGALKGQLSQTTLEKEVRKAMGNFKIAPESIEDVYTIMSSKVKMKDDGTFVVPHVIKSKDAANKEIETPAESSVETYMKEQWAVSPSAKRVLLAEFSSGGSAHGGGRGAGAGSKPWSKMTLTEQSTFMRTDPEGAKALQAAETA